MGAPQYEQAGADIGGTGTTNTIPRWTGPSTLGDSQLKDNGTLVGIGASLTSGNRLVIGGVASGTSFIKANEATFQIGNIFAGPVQILTSDTPQVTVTGTGNVGIGTASPGSRVSVRSNTTSAGATPIYTIQANRQNSDTAGFLIGMDGNLDAALAVNGDSRSIRFGKDVSATFTEWGRFDSAGRLIVGSATSPGLTSGFITAVGSSSSYLGTWKTASTAGGCLVGSGFDPLEIWRTSGTFGSETYTKILFADTSNNLILNTINTGATIQAAGTSQGIKLQGTAGTNNTDPNVLDFYADGGTANSGGVTWTPTLNFGGATTGITYAANGQVGRYTRVGNMVYLTMYIKLSSKGSATGNATITGLPTSANVPGLHASGAVGIIANITFANQMTAALLANSAELRLYETTNAGLVTTITDADFAANSELAISIAYPVN